MKKSEFFLNLARSVMDCKLLREERDYKDREALLLAEQVAKTNKLLSAKTKVRGNRLIRVIETMSRPGEQPSPFYALFLAESAWEFFQKQKERR